MTSNVSSSLSGIWFGLSERLVMFEATATVTRGEECCGSTSHASLGLVVVTGHPAVVE